MSCTVNQNQKQNQNPTQDNIQKIVQNQINNQNQKQIQIQPANQFQGDNNAVSSFWTCEELLQALSQVLRLREIFNMFARFSGSNTIDILKVPECLHAMGLHFVESTLKSFLSERLLKFPQSKPPTRVSFEFVLSIYCDLSSLEEVPTAAVMINGFRCCDTQNTGELPYNMLRRMLTLVSERLHDTEVSSLLDNMKDDKGNIKYVALLETLFPTDIDASEKLRQARLYLNALGKNASHMDMHKRDEFIRALRNLDNTHTGCVGTDQLLSLLNSNGDRFTVTELASLTRGMTNCKKQVDYRMFLRLIMND
ncbi:uncharacterized protein LOC117789653 [Drosophila innubila]|uniref:uncharacterized protein LOC117789653 n=1 Tax=Drosophila innubila TaxID=198719 RepID=UPI00148C6331|nr:uncharacterized protein LOC117789653 [Drosophila innubila]